MGHLPILDDSGPGIILLSRGRPEVEVGGPGT
jgi:hypothetical protein